MKRCHVLIVDDEVAVAATLMRVVRHALAGEDPQLHIAETPTEALFLLGNIAVDDHPIVVLADFNLKSTRTGVDLLVEMARRRPDVRRVLMSAYPRDDFEKRFPESGLDAFIQKPWKLEEISPLLQALAAERGLRGPGAIKF